MSVFDLPRLHFRGAATTHLPTGPRSGLVDLATNTALTEDGRAFAVARPAHAYHDYLDQVGPRFDHTGRPCADGPFSAAKGRDFAGNGHFSVDARIVSVEVRTSEINTADPVVGRTVDMWGHFNEYLGTTVNRARAFDVDPASDRTTTLMVGQFGFGRDGRSHDRGYLATGSVHGFVPPRWHNADHRTDIDDHWQAKELRRSVVHQFVVTKDELTWLDAAAAFPAVRLLRDTDASGLVVQFSLSHMSVPTVPDQPSRWQLSGTIAPWYPHEPRSYPAGRLLVPDSRDPCRTNGRLHNLSVELTDTHAVLNMITAVPVDRNGPVDLGDLELRTADSDRLVARLPREAYLDQEYLLACGLVTVPIEISAAAAAAEPLRLVTSGPGGAGRQLREREVNVQVDESARILEHPRDAEDANHDSEVCVRAFVRGRPSAVHEIWVRQFFNPRALPGNPAACSPKARCSDIDVVRLRSGRLKQPGSWSSTCVLGTDQEGYGWFTMRGATAGTALVLLSTDADDLPCDVDAPGSATLAYDHDDTLGYWPGAGYLSIRVLPNDWRLAGLEQKDVTFALVYREVFAFYEHLFSFMKAEVFSLADQCKVETYAKLIWQMCDPRNKARTYYMPPTRDLSEPKARLLLKYLRAQQVPDSVLLTAPATSRRSHRIANRDQLVRVLREAAAVELAVMLQYLYAAYSVPTYGVGREYVRRGVWTSEQLLLACGDGGETLDEGVRSMLLNIAREEMIHFLLVNNILVALGEPFHVPRIDFATINCELPVPLDFSLEGLGIGSIERFTLIERPENHVPDVLRADGAAAQEGAHTYASLSDLYSAIREGLQDIPDLFLVDQGRGGGEHHLFLRESVNRRYPDYQLEVDNLSSALFAIDIITEQGEGGVLTAGPDEESHYTSFLRIGELLRGTVAPGGERWQPAYPVLRNPTLRRGARAMETVTDPDARTVMALFNRAYFMALQLMAQHFGERPDGSLRRSDLMNAAIDMMTGLMRPLAELLVTLPSGRRGRTAGPSFEMVEHPAPVPRPEVARRGIARRLDDLAAECRTASLVPRRVGEMSAFWADHFRP